jgi:hypothetical protein
MSLPTERAALMDMIRAERARLEETIGAMTERQLTSPQLDGGWSPKDALAHLAYWETSMLDRVRRAAAGERIERSTMSDEERVHEIDTSNAQAYQEWRDRPLDDVRAVFAASYRDVIATLEGLSDQQIFGADGISKQLGYNVVELIAGDTYEHYQEHGDAIRAMLASGRT